MADNIVTYILGLKDEMSPKLDEATNHVKKMEGAFGGLKETVAHTVESLGISFAIFKGMEFIGEAREYVEKLDKAEANLANTMQNMGNYSKEAFEKATGAADALFHKTGYAKDEILGLQAQLGLLGNVSEEEMGRIEKVSADFAAKFGGGIQEAGNMLAKAINNPEMARRLGMQLKIDPAVMEHIQKLAKHGKEAEARLELLNIAEQKVGGAASAVFNADPLARFNVAMTDVKEEVGHVAIGLTEKLAPALEAIAETVKNVVSFTKQHSDALKTLGVFAGTVAAGLLLMKGIEEAKIAVDMISVAWTNANALATAIYGTDAEIAAGGVGILTVAQWALNVAMTANPIGIIIASVAALAAGIYYLVQRFGSWKEMLLHIWDIIKAFVVGVAKAYWGLGETIMGALTLNPSLISKGLSDTVNAVKEAGTKISETWKDTQESRMNIFSATEEAIAKKLAGLEEKGKISAVAYANAVANITSDLTAGATKGLIDEAGKARILSLLPGKAGEKKGKDGAAAIIADPKTKATGQKNVNIHIAINGGLIHGDFKIITNKLGEGLGKVKDMVAEALTGAINDSQIVSTN